jgi:hypothetical protein
MGGGDVPPEPAPQPVRVIKDATAKRDNSFAAGLKVIPLPIRIRKDWAMAII